MDLKTYIDNLDGGQVKAAELFGVKPAQVWQWLNLNTRRPSPENCVVIEAATGGAVTRKELRPNDWKLIWPELANGAKAGL